MLDMMIGGVMICAGITVVVRLVVVAYNREKIRLSESVKQFAISERNYREIFKSTSDSLAIRQWPVD